MRSCGEIGQAQPVSGEPIARAHKPTDIRHMIADILARGAQRLGARRTASLFLRHMALECPFVNQRPADLRMEFVVEPVGQAAHLDPRAGLRWQEPIRAVSRETGFLDVLCDDSRPRYRGLAIGY